MPRESSSPRSTHLGKFLEDNLESVLNEWEDFARSLLPGRSLDEEALRDHAKEILQAVLSDMGCNQSAQEQEDKSKGRRPDHAPALTQAAETHAVARLGERFNLNEMVAEYRAIRASVLRQWSKKRRSGNGAMEEVTRFNEAIDQALAASIGRYWLKLEESRDIILGTLAHDLRNPLNAIATNAEIVLRGEPRDSPSAQAAARTLKAIANMSGLIQDLLDYTVTRLGAELPLAKKMIDLAGVGAEAIDEVRAAHPGRNVGYSPCGETQGHWDPARMRQLLINLAANALQHGDHDGNVSVTVSEHGNEVIIAVHNDGPPIPETVRHLMFHPLGGRGLSALNSSGIGLGLYIAGQIALAHGGDIEVASTQEAGTTFAVRLPRDSGAATRAGGSASS